MVRGVNYWESYSSVESQWEKGQGAQERLCPSRNLNAETEGVIWSPAQNYPTLFRACFSACVQCLLWNAPNFPYASTTPSGAPWFLHSVSSHTGIFSWNTLPSSLKVQVQCSSTCSFLITELTHSEILSSLGFRDPPLPGLPASQAVSLLLSHPSSLDLSH